MKLNLCVLLLVHVLVDPLLAVEAVELLELPAVVQRAELSHAKQVADVTAKALRDIDNSKQRLLKVLNRELKSAEKKANLVLAVQLRERIDALEEKPPETTSLFGDAFASVAEQPGILILGDDLHAYKWLGGTPLENTEVSHEGKISFVPTGNNHFPLLESFVIGDKVGQVRTVSFYIFLSTKESALIFQACINGSWNNRIGIDGRAAYAGKFGWPRKYNIADVATKEWVKIEIDLIKDLGAAPGHRLSHLAFSGTDKTLLYDNVRFFEAQE